MYCTYLPPGNEAVLGTRGGPLDSRRPNASSAASVGPARKLVVQLHRVLHAAADGLRTVPMWLLRRSLR